MLCAATPADGSDGKRSMPARRVHLASHVAPGGHSGDHRRKRRRVWSADELQLLPGPALPTSRAATFDVAPRVHAFPAIVARSWSSPSPCHHQPTRSQLPIASGGALGPGDSLTLLVPTHWSQHLEGLFGSHVSRGVLVDDSGPVLDDQAIAPCLQVLPCAPAPSRYSRQGSFTVSICACCGSHLQLLRKVVLGGDANSNACIACDAL